MQSLVPGITIITVLSLFVIAGVLVKYFSPNDKRRKENAANGTDFQSKAARIKNNVEAQKRADKMEVLERSESVVSIAVHKLRSSQGEFSYENLLKRYQMTDNEIQKKNNSITQFTTPTNTTTFKTYVSSTDAWKVKSGKGVSNEYHNNKQNRDSKKFNEWIRNNISQLDRSISLTDLLNEVPIEDITYGKLLQCYQWRFKRVQVLIRDKYQCQHCNGVSESNHVHHTMYIRDELPWEIEDHKLQTLCPECHKEVHRNESIPVVEIENGIERITNREKPYCYKCGGIGYIHEFKHRDEGICYACMGRSINLGVFIKALRRYKNQGSLLDILAGRTLYQNYFNNFSLDDFNNLENYQEQPNYGVGYIDDDEDDLPF